MIEAFPLCWPVGYDKTPNWKRENSRFKITPGKALEELKKEVERISGRTNNGLIVSTNVPVKRDGYFYANDAIRKLDDPGVAVYFKYKGENVSLCCDQYHTVADNLWALVKTLDALRGIERWGVSDFLKRTFTGFKELPENSTETFWDILGIKPTKQKDEIQAAYRKKAMIAHPDKGGTPDLFQRLQWANEQASKYAMA